VNVTGTLLVKTGTLLTSPVVLQRLVGEPVHMRTLHHIERVLDQVNKEAEIAGKSHFALFKKFGKEQKDGRITIESEEGLNELKAFVEAEIPMPSIAPIKASQLEAAGVKMSVAEKKAMAELFEYDLPDEPTK